MHPCPLLPDLPSISALLCVLSVLFTVAVFVCRLSACGHGKPAAEGMWEARVCAGALGNVRSGEGGKERGSCCFLEQTVVDARGEQRESCNYDMHASPGWFGSGLVPEGSTGRTLKTRTKSQSGRNINILSVHV